MIGVLRGVLWCPMVCIAVQMSENRYMPTRKGPEAVNLDPTSCDPIIAHLQLQGLDVRLVELS